MGGEGPSEGSEVTSSTMTKEEKGKTPLRNLDRVDTVEVQLLLYTNWSNASIPGKGTSLQYTKRKRSLVTTWG